MSNVYIVCQGNIFFSWSVLAVLGSKKGAYKLARKQVQIMSTLGGRKLRPVKPTTSPAGDVVVRWQDANGFYISLEKSEVIEWM